MPKDLYLPVADEARLLAIPFAGHVPYAVTAAEASDAGQRSIEHLIEVDVGTSRSESEVQAEQVEALTRKQFLLPDARQLRGTYDSAKAAALFERFKRNGTWQVPTLVVSRQIGRLANGPPPDDSLAQYVPRGIRRFWQGVAGSEFATRTNALFPFHVELVGQLYRAGVPILAGSDCPNPYTYPGFSLHDELALLVQAGLPAAAALRAATLDPARFLGLADSLGSISESKVADLVLLDANPLADIANTRRIRAVIQGGKWWGRPSLDSLLTDAKARVAQEAK